MQLYDVAAQEEIDLPKLVNKKHQSGEKETSLACFE